jgi:tRNA pseudouridine13 synthase
MTLPGGPLPDWARAHGGPVIEAQIRSQPADFVVDEQLGFDPAGTGEHDLLRVEKTAANTQWVARRLAAHAGVKSVDVGYAGLKDRHAVTTQWFSVRRPNRDGTDWSDFQAQGVRILASRRHDRKLRPGSHAANRFRIALRGAGFGAKAAHLEQRLASIAAHGVPNYFGPQRFGRNGRNVKLAKDLFAGGRLRRSDRSYALSAARSLIFNAILDRRVRDGTWNRLLAGDRANLEGSNSVFDVDEPGDALSDRCSALDIHPSGTLWGDAAPLTRVAAARLETEVAAEYEELASGLAASGVKAASRSLRARVDALSMEVADDVVRLSFVLRAGAYATAVIRELAETG